MAEYIAMMVSVLYAVVLGLCLVSVWETRSAAADHVQAEASALHQTYLLADALPLAQRQPVREAARTYASHVVDVEWPAMAGREPLDASGWTLLDQLRRAGEVTRSDRVSEQIAARRCWPSSVTWTTRGAAGRRRRRSGSRPCCGRGC